MLARPATPGCRPARTLWALLMCLWLLGFSPPVLAASSGDPVVLGSSAEMVDIGGALSYLEDRDGSLTLEDVSGPAHAHRFLSWPAAAGDLNLGFTTSTYWIRIRLARQADARPGWMLEIPYLSLDDIVFHAPGQPGIRTGSAQPVSTRPFPDRFYVFPIEVGTEPATYYLQVRSRYAMTVPIRLWAPAALAGHTLKTQVLHILYQGAIVALALYNLLIYLSLGDRRFLLYALFASSFGMGMFSGNGYGGLLLWPESPAFNAVAQSFWLAVAAALGLMFSREFLFGRAMRGRLITAMRLVEGVMLGCAGLLVLATWTPSLQQVVNMILVVSAPAAGLLILTAAVRELRQGRRSSLLFLLAWGTLWLGAFVATGRALGWLPTNVWSAHALQIASSVEMLLLALALADMIRIERENRDRAQLQALQAQAETVKLLSSSEERLERAVRERTEQLQQALDKEQKALAGHMRLAALVSHEFRNPLAVVDGQITLMRREQALGLQNMERRLTAIAGATARLRRLFERWMQNDRLRTSIDAIDPRVVPLEAWLREFLQAHPEFATDHEIELACDPGPMDIVADEHLLDVAIGNLVANACAYSAPGTTVTIRAHRSGMRVALTVIDQGIGIHPTHLDKVFEPYFRAQPEDQTHGMGLGLNFVRRIAVAHGWEIELQSQPGKGSEFRLWMPASPDHVTEPASA
jgi:signal transduction histidine kinase